MDISVTQFPPLWETSGSTMKGKKTWIGKSDRQTYRKSRLLLALYHPSCVPVQGTLPEEVANKCKCFSALIYSFFFYFNSLWFNSHLLGTDKLPVLTGTNAFRKWIWKPCVQTCKEIELFQIFSGIDAISPSPNRKQKKNKGYSLYYPVRIQHPTLSGKLTEIKPQHVP